MEKLPTHTGETHGASQEPRWMAPQKRPRRAIFLRRVFIVFCFLAGYYMLIRPRSTQCMSPECAPCDTSKCLAPGQNAGGSKDFAAQNHEHEQAKISQDPITSQSNESTRIPLEAHIMSKCPDAQGCLQKLILPAMEQISDKVDFRLSFIASVSKETSDIQCMHGPAECIGNMLMLCAANLPFPPTSDRSLLPQNYPRTPIIRSLGFANCLINDYTRIPDRGLVHQCALEHGIDFDALNQCASQQSDAPDDGQRGKSPLSGIALLRHNALHSEHLDVHTSCTVRLDDSVWCIHDGGVWKTCAQDGEGSKPQVLADEIKRLWQERN
ncbi:Gamma interferon inducible lysosomal thiol reductase GILT [Penicillium pulvis]|uniref:Gamma interferon inducible lysosomal thiol reductase GILT n=1 Tax=Penicillium pulvis TaxID=1562058 RepID=UPI002549BBF7|nr:Gamma interferon inducible lysosomal thiol reductase GILT [Penicillium pulvis]KAJ5803174.1 Gamma interferon inducible lysosomal thiol reductase GILT [Penicillium pulvis]